MVRYSVLGSGSCGNSYIFTYDNQSILIDAGYSLKQIKERLSNNGFDYDSILALFLTHLHPDHAHAAGTFARQTGKSVCISPVAQLMCKNEIKKLNIPQECNKVIDPSGGIEIGPFKVECFYTSHDSAGSVGYSIKVGDRQFVIVTDTGHFNTEMVSYAQSADVLFLESNYDEDMLAHGPYPAYLKKRVASERGHLSNNQAKEFLYLAGFDVNDKPVYLIHISDNNNDVRLVQEVMKPFNATVCARGSSYKNEI